MHKTILRPLIVTALILILPLIGINTVEGWNWTGSDFVGAGVLLFIPALAFELLIRKSGSLLYKLGAALAVLTIFLIVWVNLAVGIIGDEDNPSNVLYFFAVITAISGWFVAGTDARRIARAMFATAAVLVLIPLLIITGAPNAVLAESSGMVRYLALSSFFVLMFVGSALMFRKSVR